MLESWVVIATNRNKEPLLRAAEVLKTKCNLAISVDKNEATYHKLKPLQEEHPKRFLLTFGAYRQSVEASNYIYGLLRERDPPKNLMLIPIPDDMVLKDGWYDTFCHCYNTLGISQDGVGVLVGSDGRSKCNVAGFAGITAKFCDIYQRGWLSCPTYLHWYLDHETTHIANAVGKYYRCPSAQAFHELIDYHENQKSADWAHDEALFHRRRGARYPFDDIEEPPWRYWR